LLHQISQLAKTPNFIAVGLAPDKFAVKSDEQGRLWEIGMHLLVFRKLLKDVRFLLASKPVTL
jgi:hypothetical protein